MKIVRIESWREHAPLSRPYAISSVETSAVELFFVRAITQTEAGLGSGTPVEFLTGESVEACEAAIAEDKLQALVGLDVRHLGAACAAAGELLRDTPAARAAVDIALHDLHARILDVPLVDLLGRRLGPLPTSITLGIQSTEDALAEVDEYLGRGFRCLKVKIGSGLDSDLERLRAIRARAGPSVRIRVDGNEGYSWDETLRLGECAVELGLELIEQPLPVSRDGELDRLPASLRSLLALDESVHDEHDALEHARSPDRCATYVVKLMKCGGITAARSIAAVASAADRGIMWGCMDESAVSIAAALHTAYASPATRYLDLDGNFDLALDPAGGGFRLVDGELHLLDVPGLGVELVD